MGDIPSCPYMEGTGCMHSIRVCSGRLTCLARRAQELRITSWVSCFSYKCYMYGRRGHMYGRRGHMYGRRGHMYERRGHMYGRRGHMYGRRGHM